MRIFGVELKVNDVWYWKKLYKFKRKLKDLFDINGNQKFIMIGQFIIKSCYNVFNGVNIIWWKIKWIWGCL